jgi:hypothetical protein
MVYDFIWIRKQTSRLEQRLRFAEENALPMAVGAFFIYKVRLRSENCSFSGVVFSLKHSN